jgi:hypothetical protein
MSGGSTLLLSGNVQITPLSTYNSGSGIVPFPLYELVALSKRHLDEVLLSTNAVTSISLGGLTEVNVLILRTTGGKVRARVTTSDGTEQAIPVSPLLVSLTGAVGITAIDVMRDNTLTNEVRVEILLGQKA